MTQNEIFSVFGEIDDRYISQACNARGVIRMKQSFCLFFAGFLLTSIIDDLLYHIIALYITHGMNRPFLLELARMCGYICLIAAGERFCREQPRHSYIRGVQMLSFAVCLIMSAKIVLSAAYYLGDLTMGDLYVPIRLRIAFYLLKGAIPVCFALGCRQWLSGRSLLWSRLAALFGGAYALFTLLPLLQGRLWFYYTTYSHYDETFFLEGDYVYGLEPGLLCLYLLFFVLLLAGIWKMKKLAEQGNFQ